VSTSFWSAVVNSGVVLARRSTSACTLGCVAPRVLDNTLFWTLHLLCTRFVVCVTHIEDWFATFRYTCACPCATSQNDPNSRRDKSSPLSVRIGDRRPNEQANRQTIRVTSRQPPFCGIIKQTTLSHCDTEVRHQLSLAFCINLKSPEIVT